VLQVTRFAAQYCVRDLLPVMRLNPLSFVLCLLPLLLSLQVGASGQAETAQVSSIAAALQAHEYQKALQLLQPALQQAPGNPQLWMLQGLAYAGKGNSQSALTSYQRAIKISPDYHPALEGAAQIEYETGSAEAVPLLEHILKLRPDDSTSHAMLAVMAEKNGDCSTAVHTTQRVRAFSIPNRRRCKATALA